MRCSLAVPQRRKNEVLPLWRSCRLCSAPLLNSRTQPSGVLLRDPGPCAHTKRPTGASTLLRFERPKSRFDAPPFASRSLCRTLNGNHGLSLGDDPPCACAFSWGLAAPLVPCAVGGAGLRKPAEAAALTFVPPLGQARVDCLFEHRFDDGPPFPSLWSRRWRSLENLVDHPAFLPSSGVVHPRRLSRV